MTIETILNLVVIVLLVPTIVYAVILNRRLTALRTSRDELAKVVGSFNDATLRAEAGIPKLKKATTEANLALKDRVEKAQTLRDDLAFMIERAEELATRLEGAVRNARSEALPTPGTAAPAPSLRPAMASAAEALAAARLVAAAAPAATLGQPGSVPFDSAAAELRNALSAARAEARVSGAPGASTAGLGRGARRPLADDLAVGGDRSEAERELLKALQTAR
ncbi:MAG: hypothetical protein FJX59_05000 [Alphaproteobacteria bacterium]|nr:hypothetical protein [Alphaproteobacteria bacterium]